MRGIDLEFFGMLFEPAYGVVDVLQRGRIDGIRRHAEIKRRHHHAGARQRCVGAFVAGAVLVTPGATVNIDDQRKRARAARNVNTRLITLVAVTDVFDIAHVDVVTRSWCFEHDDSPCIFRRSV